MGAKTSIEWTDTTWNPVRGCSRVSEGCRHCYAEAVAARFSGPGQPYEGFASRRVERAFGTAWTGKVELVEKHLTDPIRWTRPRRVFVNSMSDLFHEALPDEAIDLVFAAMALAPHHVFQVLTKRAARMRDYLAKPLELERAVRLFRRISEQVGSAHMPSGTWIKDGHWALPHVWLGVSVEDQGTASERIPLLLQTPAAVRFVSYEPALGPVDFSRFVIPASAGLPCWCRGPLHPWEPGEYCPPSRNGNIGELHWIIVGGESGPGARPFDVAWARSTVEQCRAAGVACFVKQLGARPTGWKESYPHTSHVAPPRLDAKGGSMHQWPEDLRVREFPKGGNDGGS